MTIGYLQLPSEAIFTVFLKLFNNAVQLQCINIIIIGTKIDIFKD